jgi:hypothetical protein
VEGASRQRHRWSGDYLPGRLALIRREARSDRKTGTQVFGTRY